MCESKSSELANAGGLLYDMKMQNKENRKKNLERK